MNPVLPADFPAIAQIAIALMGFTGIIGAVQTRGGAILSEFEKVHIINLLLATAFATLCSFVPSWISLIGMTTSQTWRASFCVLLGVHLLSWVLAFPYMKRAQVFVPTGPTLYKISAIVLVVCGITSVIAEIFVVAGKIEHLAAFVYESVLIFLVALAMFNFICLLIRPVE